MEQVIIMALITKAHYFKKAMLRLVTRAISYEQCKSYSYLTIFSLIARNSMNCVQQNVNVF